VPEDAMNEPLIGSLISRYEVSLDDKRRFSVPPPLRPMFTFDVSDGIRHHVVVLPWFGTQLAMFSVPAWKRIEARWLASGPGAPPEVMAAKRAVGSRTVLTHTDPEGRIVLPPEHLAWLGIPAGSKDRLMVIGATSHVEVWKADTWAAEDAVTPERYARYLGILIPPQALNATAEGEHGEDGETS
jgi:DNA-binding transcriptional regulator/RsmH inhibitor MraZ